MPPTLVDMSQPPYPPGAPGTYVGPQFVPPGAPLPAPGQGHQLPGQPSGPYVPQAQLPYLPPGPGPVPGAPQPLPQLSLQRPAVVGMAATMAVTASLQWICVLSFAWLVATAGAANLSLQGGEGGLFHLLHRFHISMVDGLAWPLYGLPLLSFFAGFLVLAPRPWARWTLTGTGLIALGWSAWWLQDDLIWWLAPALYILISCLLLWTPGASRWYRQRGLVQPYRPF